MKKIIFVCLGNICRSPMAEFVMKDLLQQAGLVDEVQVESRATSTWEHGNPVHPGTQKVLRQHGIPFDTSKKSQSISPGDFRQADLILAMDQQNLTDLSKRAPQDQANSIRLLLDESVPDPWYTGDFEETYDLVLTGCQQVLQDLQAGKF